MGFALNEFSVICFNLLHATHGCTYTHTHTHTPNKATALIMGKRVDLHRPVAAAAAFYRGALDKSSATPIRL